MSEITCRYCERPVPARKVYCLDCGAIAEREKIRAVSAVKKAISEGKLIHPKSCKCACGKPAFGYAHSDYGRPLDVFPVCRSCNRIRTKPAQIASPVAQYVASKKRKKELPSGIVSRTRIIKGYCKKCADYVALNGRVCMRCGEISAKKVETKTVREHIDRFVKERHFKISNNKARNEAWHARAQALREKYEGRG